MTEGGHADYFSGQQLYGDDFTAAQIQDWFRDEENAYLELYAQNPDYEYEYELLNVRHGFRHLSTYRHFETVLGLGSAYGDELSPIAGQIGRLVIIESADSYQRKPALDVPTEWRKASVAGDLKLDDASVDLATCFGVLHHIPNVTHVVRELGRVIKTGGFALVREPVISMGDWSAARPGLTPHERGIPRHILHRQVAEAGFVTERETLCFFSGTSVMGRLTKRPVYDKKSWIILDELASKVFSFNYRYHPNGRWQKVRPTSTFLVLRRAGSSDNV
jgi:SAM-dependent methyltransferase